MEGVRMLSCSVLSDFCNPLGWGAHHIPQTMGFFRQEYWSGLPFPPPGDLPDPGIEPGSPVSPAVAGRVFITEPPVKPQVEVRVISNFSGHTTYTGSCLALREIRIYLDVVSICALHLTLYPKFCYHPYPFRLPLLIISSHVILQGKAH